LLISPVAVDFDTEQNVSILQIGTDLTARNKPRKTLRRRSRAIAYTASSVANISTNINARPIVKIGRHVNAAGDCRLSTTYQKNGRGTANTHVSGFVFELLRAIAVPKANLQHTIAADLPWSSHIC
jgi:hypothetical protein